MISSLKWWCNELNKNVCLGGGAFEGHDEVWSKTLMCWLVVVVG